MVTSQTYTLLDGIQISFTDSGAPPASSDYTTLIMFHGSAFTAAGCERLHTSAHRLNLRTVIWARRDYQGSSQYTDAELADLNAGSKVFLDRLALLVADFIRVFVERERVPKITADRKRGGFALMGWSMGVATAMAVLSDPALFGQAQYEFLEEYVKDLVLDDPPYQSLGYTLPPGSKVYEPFEDPDVASPEEMYQNFGLWVSSYWSNPETAQSIDELDFRKRGERSTVASWTPEQLERFYDGEAALRSEFPMMAPPMRATLRATIECVFFDPHLAATFFPRVPVTHLWGSRGTWHSVWGYIENKKVYDGHVAQGRKVREMRFVKIEGGNHFAHWDMPDKLLECAVAGMRA